MPANVAFLPWVRQGAASAIPTPDTLDAQAGAVTLTATLTINGTNPPDDATNPPISMDARLLGPSDVIGINPQDIVRREPPPNTTAFESNHFAGIEFDRPDFPWLFTPAKAGANARLRPWLCLIVVRAQDGVTVRPAVSKPLASLEIAAPAVAGDELPDLAESWLWAHSQAASGDGVDVNVLRSTLAGDPALSLSRLLCPRLLTPNTEYIACLVPAFEAGRKAGLGLPVESSEVLQPAWTAASIAQGTVTLPLYDHWTFKTGAGGDFKTLAKLLHAEPAPAGLGKRPIDISQPGFTLPTTFPAHATLQLEGALKPLRTDTTLDWPANTKDAFQEELATIVNSTEALPSEDPLLAPPLYGRWHAGSDEAKRTPPGLTWFDELNLDPRHRVVAAFGTRVVQEHQEALMASAWEQAGNVQAANQRMRQLQLSLIVGQSLHARHFERMETDSLLRVAGPALKRARGVGVAGDSQLPTMVAEFVRTALPLNSLTPAMRKLSRTRGPASRRLFAAANINAGMSRFVARVNEFVVTAFTPPVPAMATFNAVRQRSASLSTLLGYSQVNSDLVDGMPGAPQFQIVPEGTRMRMPVEGTAVPLENNPAAVAFRAAASAHLKKANPSRPWISVFLQPRQLDLSEIRGRLTVQMNPRATLVALADATVPGRAAITPTNDDVPVSTVMYAPQFPQPMYEALRDLSQDLMLPGLNEVTPNSVIGLLTNPRFVNAYMVGLNFEMGRELLWRGYPTDQRGTYFAQFWDTAGSDKKHLDVDPPLHQWGDRELSGVPSEASGKFVMLLRSELLRRYPTAAIYAAPALRINGKRVLDPNSDHEEHPAFRGSLPPDITFIGFNLSARDVVGGDNAGEGYFIVIQEQATEPRFGLDDGLVAAGSTYLNAASGAPAGLSLRNLEWRENGAHMAGITRRLPVRIAIHASQFVAHQDLPPEN
jgi:hypothetical protein